MAEEVKSESELDRIALQIYAQRVAANPVRRDGEKLALECYKLATDFISARGKVAKGALNQVKKTGPQLAEFDAPNLPRTHPHRLVASTGKPEEDARKLRRIHEVNEWLQKHPTPEGDPLVLVEDFKDEFGDLAWDLPTINVARAVFPMYCSGQKKAG